MRVSNREIEDALEEYEEIHNDINNNSESYEESEYYDNYILDKEIRNRDKEKRIKDIEEDNIMWHNTEAINDIFYNDVGLAMVDDPNELDPKTDFAY